MVEEGAEAEAMGKQGKVKDLVEADRVEAHRPPKGGEAEGAAEAASGERQADCEPDEARTACTRASRIISDSIGGTPKWASSSKCMLTSLVSAFSKMGTQKSSPVCTATRAQRRSVWSLCLSVHSELSFKRLWRSS